MSNIIKPKPFVNDHDDIEPKNYIFISYSSKDSDIVLHDLVELQKRNVRLWYDDGISSTRDQGYWDTTVKNIISSKNCSGVVFYLSDNFIKSSACKKEVQMTLDLNKEYFSVNLGNKNMRSLLIESKDYIDDSSFDLLSKMFPTNKVYINRSYEPSSNLHMRSLLESLSNWSIFDYSEPDFDYEIVKSEVVLLKYLGNEDIVVIPDHIGEFPVTTIGESCFENKKVLRYITFGNNITHIKQSAFFGCVNLLVVQANHNLKFLDSMCFARCENLIRINNADKILKIGESAFFECISLSQFTFPSTLNYIGPLAFANCESLLKVSFESFNASFEDYPFQGCNNLSILDMLNGVPKSVTDYFLPFNFRGVIFTKQIFHNSFIFVSQANKLAPFIRFTLGIPLFQTVDDFSVSWKPVEKADYYQVLLNDMSIVDTFSLTYRIDNRNLKSLCVRAVSNNDSFIFSPWSNEIRINGWKPVNRIENLECVKQEEVENTPRNSPTINSDISSINDFLEIGVVLYFNDETKIYTIAMHEIDIFTEGETYQEIIKTTSAYISAYIETEIEYIGDQGIDPINKFSDILESPKGQININVKIPFDENSKDLFVKYRQLLSGVN